MHSIIHLITAYVAWEGHLPKDLNAAELTQWAARRNLALDPAPNERALNELLKEMRKAEAVVRKW
jgi:hypothetical protein